MRNRGEDCVISGGKNGVASLMWFESQLPGSGSFSKLLSGILVLMIPFLAYIHGPLLGLLYNGAPWEGCSMKLFDCNVNMLISLFKRKFGVPSGRGDLQWCKSNGKGARNSTFVYFTTCVNVSPTMFIFLQSTSELGIPFPPAFRCSFFSPFVSGSYSIV